MKGPDVDRRIQARRRVEEADWEGEAETKRGRLELGLGLGLARRKQAEVEIGGIDRGREGGDDGEKEEKRRMEESERVTARDWEVGSKRRERGRAEEEREGGRRESVDAWTSIA